MTEQQKDKWLVCKYLVLARCSRPGTCAMQEKCSEYADFCESIMDELTENEDEDPPCPIECDKRADPNQASLDAATARQARTKLLEQISKKMKHDLEFSEQYEDKTSGAASTYYGSRAACLSHYLEYLESLRQEPDTQ